MDLIKNLRTDIWQSVPAENLSGLKPYTIIRTDKCTEPGSYRYAIKEIRNTDEEDAQLALVTLHGATGKKDPLDQLRNVHLSLDNNCITAVNVDGDAVKRIQC